MNIKNKILKLRIEAKRINNIIDSEIEKLENQLKSGLINDDQFDTLEDEIYYKYDIDSLNSQIFRLEREYINIYKNELIEKELFNSDLKFLFAEANKSIKIHNKLINKILN